MADEDCLVDAQLIQDRQQVFDRQRDRKRLANRAGKSLPAHVPVQNPVLFSQDRDVGIERAVVHTGSVAEHDQRRTGFPAQPVVDAGSLCARV